MLYIQKQSKMKALRFVATIPLLALLMMAFSFTERFEQGQQQTNVPEQKLIVAGINWEEQPGFYRRVPDRHSGDQTRGCL